jgi:arylsulfatase A-like enzyme
MRTVSRPGARRRAFLTGVLVLAGAATGLWILRRQAHPPLRVETTVADLIAAPSPATVLEQAPNALVRTASLAPHRAYGNVMGRARHALVAPPPARLRFRLRMPAGAALRLGVGVEGEGKRDPERAGIRFSATLDGRPIFTRVVNPAATRHDRRWFDASLDLGVTAEREAELVLATERVGRGRLAGTPGWSPLRLVRASSRARQAAQPDRPSVLVVVVDALRADHVGCYGREPTLTPTLDQLAAEGLVFDDAVAQSPWTLPSVSTLLTGLHPRSHGAIGAAPDGGEPERAALPDVVPTLAQAAIDAGVTTVGVSANPLVSAGTNLARGFETFVELGWNRAARDWEPASVVNARFLDWLEAHRGLRFLAYLHYMDAHDPYGAPADRPPPPPDAPAAVARGDVTGFAARLDRGGPAAQVAPFVPYLRMLYAEGVRHWDRELARLLGSIAALGVHGSTVVLVTADHGEEFLEHGRLKHRRHLYDESLRVPLILVGPGVPPGRRTVQVQGVDVFPTVAALLDLAAPPDLPGTDVLNAPAERPAVAETRYGAAPDGSVGSLRALRTADWKLIQGPGRDHVELYDLRRDAAERNDRAATSETADLLAALAAWEVRTPGPPATGVADPTLREKLRVLGYL